MTYPTALTFALTDPESPDGVVILTRFFDDLVTSFWSRPARMSEVTNAMQNEPSDDLRGETGFLLRVLDGAAVVGCGGVRRVGEDGGEVTRVFLAAEARGRGAGRALLRELEARSARLGIRRLRLTVRDDLTDARRLYDRAGYRPVAPFSTSPYADHFLGKDLATPERQA